MRDALIVCVQWALVLVVFTNDPGRLHGTAVDCIGLD
jgi:hypothetical protein